MPQEKPIWQSMTFWVNIFFILVSVAEVLKEVDLSFLPDEQKLLIIGIANILLRIKTRVPVRVV